MLYIPAGEFEMGSSDVQIAAALEGCERDRGSGRCEREWFGDEAPPHPVTLDAYWSDRTEVTNAQYAAFLNEGGNQVEGGVAWLEGEDEKSLIEQVDGEYRPEAGYADHPAIKVSWYGALAYCDWVGGELPTEAMCGSTPRAGRRDTRIPGATPHPPARWPIPRDAREAPCRWAASRRAPVGAGLKIWPAMPGNGSTTGICPIRGGYYSGWARCNAL